MAMKSGSKPNVTSPANHGINGTYHLQGAIKHSIERTKLKH